MTHIKSKITAALLLAAGAVAAQAADIRYVQTNGIEVTTSETQYGYLTGALQFTTSTGGSFEAYCVELAQGHGEAADGFLTYTVGSFTPAQSTLLQGLFSSSYASVSSVQDKAAFQTAIWEIIQEPTGGALDAKSGSFVFRYLSDTSTDAQDTAFASQINGYLTAASSYNGPAQYQLTKLVNPQFQDYVAISAAVPEPETYALLLAGLGAIGFIARRRGMR